MSSLRQDTAVFDQARLRERVDHDDDLLRELIELFQKEHTVLLSQMRSAIQNHDPEELERSAHALKGAVAILGALAAQSAAQHLETVGRDKRMSDAPDAYTTLEREIERLQQALSAMGISA